MRRRSRRELAVVWVLACALGGAPASADEVVKVANVPESGPVLLGPGVAWAEVTDSDGFRVVDSMSGVRHSVAEFNPGGTEIVVEPELASDGVSLAVVRTGYRPGDGYGDTPYSQLFMTGSSSGSLVAISSEFPGRGDRSESVQVSGNRIAYFRPGCDDAGSSSAVYDMSADPPTTICVARSFGQALAGHFLAYLERPPDTSGPISPPNYVVVRDIQSGTESYRFPASALPDRQSIEQFAIRDDGYLALISRNAANKDHLYWASPSEPSPHVVPLGTARYVAVAWAGKRLLVVRSPKYVFGTINDGRLDLLDLGGRIVHAVARGITDALRDPRFAVLGQRIAYVSRSCHGAAIHVVARTSKTRQYAPLHCRLAIRAAPRVTGHGKNRTITIAASCRGFLARCAAASASVSAPDSTTGKWRRISLGSSSGDHGTITLFPTKTGMRLLDEHRSLRIRVTARIGDLAGDITSVQSRTALLRLKP